jgi:hypothetical protein
VIGKRFGWLLAWLVWLCALPSSASAAVEVAFYSKEFGSSFPHAFITVRGVIDGTGEKVDASYGFTAKSISPAILMGSVAGKIVASSASYIAKSDRHFSLMLSDAEYLSLLATVEKWRSYEQPSYNLNRRNCVFFVADLAAALGLKAETPQELMKKPRSYLQYLVRTNRAWLHQRGAQLEG